MADSADAGATRRESILDAAVAVFRRYGFKKTSMDDLARAAKLSRQGLYLHFATKEELFKEALLHLLATMRAACQAALARQDIPVEQRLFEAIQAIISYTVGAMAEQHTAELLAASEQLLGPVLRAFETNFVADLAKFFQTSGVMARWKGEGVSAKELALQLHATVHGLKYIGGPPAELGDRIRLAIKMICRTSR